jgi:hypothetical protein
VKTVFTLFEEFENAYEAVDRLQDEDFDSGQMNVIVLENIAKDAMEVDLEKVKVEKTGQVGEKSVTGLDELLGGQKAVDVPNIGDVYAAGSLATMLVRSASAPGAVEGGLEAALQDFNLTGEAAEGYRKGLEEGGLLFFIRSQDEKASDIVQLLRQNKGKFIADV